jgi:hypothetical protein
VKYILAVKSDEGKFLGFEDLLQLMFKDFGRQWIKKVKGLPF